MAKNLIEQVADLLTPFQKDIGTDMYPKVCEDMASFLGRQTITTIEGDWKTNAGLKLASRDLHKMQLPPNAPQSHLIWFAIRLNEVASAGSEVSESVKPYRMDIQATVPYPCKAWLEKSKLRKQMSTATA